MIFLSVSSLATSTKQVPQLCEDPPKVYPGREGVGSIDLPAAMIDTRIMYTQN